MWFFDADGRLGFGAILEEEQVSKPRAHCCAECPFAEGGPQIQGAAHCLFRPIVEIVSEGRADLRFGFEGSNQLPFHDDHKVPLFRWTKIARELQESPAVVNVAAVDSRLDDEISKKLDEGIHLRAARDCRAKPLIRAACGLLLCDLF